jgi:hypothetical protein
VHVDGLVEAAEALEVDGRARAGCGRQRREDEQGEE